MGNLGNDEWGEEKMREMRKSLGRIEEKMRGNEKKMRE